MKEKSFRIADQDQQCFYELWRWKLLTTASLQLLAYKNRSSFQSYRRMLTLEKAGYIRSIWSLDQGICVWQLGDKGYDIIEENLGLLKQGGFRSEHKDHDFWVTAIHLGEWVNGIPHNCDIFSEQQLRRMDMNMYPEWVPSVWEHRPDGWWCIDNTKPRSESLIGLEIEISKKSPSDYQEVGDFYSNRIDVHQVIWLVRTKRDIDYIFKNLKYGSKKGALEHSFVGLDQYLERQWQSEIIFGKNVGKKIIEILGTSDAQSTTMGWPLCS